MKSLKKLLLGLFALSASALLFVACPQNPEENVEVASVTFSPAGGGRSCSRNNFNSFYHN